MPFWLMTNFIGMFYFWIAGETSNYIASIEEVDCMKGVWEKCIGGCKGAKSLPLTAGSRMLFYL